MYRLLIVFTTLVVLLTLFVFYLPLFIYQCDSENRRTDEACDEGEQEAAVLNVRRRLGGEDFRHIFCLLQSETNEK